MTCQVATFLRSFHKFHLLKFSSMLSLSQICFLEAVKRPWLRCVTWFYLTHRGIACWTGAALSEQRVWHQAASFFRHFPLKTHRLGQHQTLNSVCGRSKELIHIMIKQGTNHTLGLLNHLSHIMWTTLTFHVVIDKTCTQKNLSRKWKRSSKWPPEPAINKLEDRISNTTPCCLWVLTTRPQLTPCLNR